MTRSAMLFLVVALAACESPTAPAVHGVEPVGAQEFAPPPSYTAAAQALLACTGDARDPVAFVAGTRWFAVTDFDDRRDGLRFPIGGLWRPGVGIYLRDPGALWIVTHELNHVRLNGDDRHLDPSWRDCTGSSI